jgi:hypothetical protein
MRPDRADAKQRLAERDARIAADTRTEIEKWLNDPPPHRSALARRTQQPIPQQRTSVSGTRVDLWKR